MHSLQGERGGKSYAQARLDFSKKVLDHLEKIGKVTPAQKAERLNQAREDYLKRHKAPDAVVNEPIHSKYGFHQNPNKSYLGHKITYRHDVDHILANLRKWDVSNAGKSLKMKWLKEVFPGKSAKQIYEMASPRRKDLFGKTLPGGLYPAVTHQARDVLGPRGTVRLGHTERDIGYSLRAGEGGNKSPAIVQEMHARVEDALKRFGFKGKVVVANREDFPVEAKRSSPHSEGFIMPDGTIYIDAAKNSTHADAIYTAFHEAFHRGELGSEAAPYAKELERAGRNPTVKAIADAIKKTNSNLGYEINDTHATREALAEIHGAQKTGRWEELANRTAKDVDVSPLAKAQAYGVVRRVINSLKSVFSKMFGRAMTDREITDLVHNTFKRSSESVKTISSEINHSIGLRRAELNTPQFKKWFGESKVKSASGEPQLVYHGTGERFTVFDKSKLGTANEHSTSPLGHFFTADRNLALKYAERASEGRPADQVMVPAYLKIAKPHEMTLEQAQAIETPEEARALRAKLEGQGFDGVKITSPHGDTWVAFESEQVKSPYNKGEFNPTNPDIMHSIKREKTPEEKRLEFSKKIATHLLDTKKITKEQFDKRIADATAKAAVKPAAAGPTKTQQLNEAIGTKEAPHYEDLIEPLSTIGKTARAWSYFSMLTSLRTIPRIFATSINETAIRPIEEMFGIISSKLAPNVAALAPRYGGGLNVAAEGKAFNAIFQGEEYLNMARTGRTSIDADIGNLLDKYRGKLPKEEFDKLEELANNWKMMASAHTGILAAPGRIHGALHTMPMLAEYARSTEKRTAFIVKKLKAQDMSDQDAAFGVMKPLAQLDIQMGAYADALSAAYRGETTVGKYYDKAIKALRDGGGMANAFASLLQIANPFVKVSANLFSRATSFAGGGVKAIAEFAHAKRQGFMTPEQADYIIKNMNAQGIGVAAILLGAMYYKQMGGLYDPKTYNRKDMPETGTILFDGVGVPAHVLEHPAIQIAQLGAMVTRGIFEHRGGAAALAGAKDLANIASVVRSSGDLSKAMESSNGALKYIADMVTSRLIPAPARDVAAIQDYMDNGPGHPGALEALWHYMFLDDAIKRKVKTGEDVLKKQLVKTPLNPKFNVQDLPRRE